VTEEMKAAIYRGPGKLTIESVPIPKIGPSDALVKVHNCGICGSDLHSYKAGMYIEPGQIMGHEFMGTVAAVGDRVEGIAEGDRVTGFSIGICGSCYWCSRQQYILCPELFQNSTGYGLPGGFAEYVPIRNAVVGQSIHRVPDELDDETAATAEPVSVGIGAIDAAEVRPGDRVVVLGAGMIGNACMQAAKAAEAEQVAVVDVSPIRLDAAKRLGADAVFDARTGDALEWVKETIGVGRYHFNEGGMADVVVEAAGAPMTVQQAFEMVRSGGTIVFVGLPEEPAPIDVTKIVHKQPRIVGSLGGDFARALELLASEHIKTKELITRRFPLEEIPEAFETQMQAAEVVKVMIQPARR
jgi:threonine dehydrogenase-like Zn-dependent dehydrogenase